MKTAIYKILLSAIALQFSLGAKAQVIIRFAGDTLTGDIGDLGPATAAELNQPWSLARDAAGNTYIGEGNGSVIRKVDVSGTITTIAGTGGVFGYTGDSGPATAALIKGASGLAFDGAGNLFFTDFSNNSIRKIDMTSGIISTIAGSPIGTSGYSGDGGPATAALFNHPLGIAIDASNNIYVSDWNNYVIRKIDASTGIISNVAGTHVSGFSGDGTPATGAQISTPYHAAFDASGNFFFADLGNNRIRKIDMTTGIITSVAGSTSGFFGDGGPATGALLTGPSGVSFDAAGNMYIADRGNGRIRKVNTGGTINTIAGIGVSAEFGDGGPATAAALNRPFEVICDANFNLYIADINGNTVRKIIAIPVAAFTAPASLCEDSCTTLTSSGTGTLDSLTWSIPGITIGSPHSTTISPCFPTPGTYTVSLNTYNISGSSLHTASVVVNPPPHPVITVTSVVFFSVPAIYSSYQWYSLPSTPIAGATTNTYTASGLGGYYVVADSGSCLGRSDTVYVVEGVPALNQNENKFWLSQHSNNTLTLFAAQPIGNELTINIYDATGKQILSDKWKAGSNTMQLNGISVASGLYVIKLSNQNTSLVLKWMKQ